MCVCVCVCVCGWGGGGSSLELGPHLALYRPGLPGKVSCVPTLIGFWKQKKTTIGKTFVQWGLCKYVFSPKIATQPNHSVDGPMELIGKPKWLQLNTDTMAYCAQALLRLLVISLSRTRKQETRAWEACYALDILDV